MAKMLLQYDIKNVKPLIITVKHAEKSKIFEKTHIYSALDYVDCSDKIPDEKTIVVRYNAEGELDAIEVWEGKMDDVAEKIRRELEKSLDPSEAVVCAE